MKRILAMLFLCVILLGSLAMPASAESVASRVDLLCTVNSEGDCLVTMNVTLRLDQAYESLTFPLPANARDITLNNSSASTRKTDSAIQVDISRYTRNYVGELPLVFNFMIPEAVKVSRDEIKIGEERKLVLTIPMLNGFELPVENLSFIINMPSPDMTDRPNFTSTYRQESVGSDLSYEIDRNQIIGSSKRSLNDHDGITMTMVVPREMFPTVSVYVREGNPELPYIIGFAVAAMVYWLLFLRTWPLIRSRTSTPPEGITAGELGCRLTLCGGDLTMMVFSWAQLGYLLIRMEGKGKVVLIKRMDMGNERNAYENKVFRILFGNRQMVDATGMTYARLCRKVASKVPNERNMYRGNSGNVKIFRLLGCVSMIFCGICVAMNMTTIPALYIILSIILGIFGAVSGWLIQAVPYRTHLRGKTPVYIGFLCILIWIGLGLLCTQVWIPLGCCVGEFVLGFFAAYGGRRSELGRHDAAQVLGLRQFVKHLQPEEISRMMRNDPDYFFNMAPHALALGVINPFARGFGRRNLELCPYLLTHVKGKHSAEDWGHLMSDAADLMDQKSRQLMWINLIPQKEMLPKPKKTAKKPAPKQKKKSR